MEHPYYFPLQNHLAKMFKIFTPFLSLLFSLSIFAQNTLKGTITDENNQIVVGANIFFEALQKGTVSKQNGQYELTDLPNGDYQLTVSHISFATVQKNITLTSDLTENIRLKSDPLHLETACITGSFNPKTKLESSLSVTTLNEKERLQRNAKGTADLLRAVPGTFVDASAGEVFTRVYSRGISALAEDDIGWYYVALQEDGLPVTAIQHTYFSPDLFHRADLSTERLEAIRGGASAITGNNAPGGIYNFISKTGGNQYGGELRLSTALEGDNNPFFRTDLNIGGPIAGKGWAYNIGGFYRWEEGARNTDINWSNGGQVKLNILKKHKNGFVKIYGKYLNDKVNRYSGIAATNWDNPEAAFGQNFNTTALVLPPLETQIADGRAALNDPAATLEYNPNKGIKTKDIAVGLAFEQKLPAKFILKNNLKFSDKSANWQSTIANQPIGLESFFPYVLNGFAPNFDDFLLGQIVFRDAKTGEDVARVNNFGAFAPLFGSPDPPSFEYISGELPFDAVMGIAPWRKIDKSTDLMNQLSIGQTIGNYQWTAGTYIAHSSFETYTSGSYAYATYEAEPRMLAVTLENPDEEVIHISDSTGISNYGGLLYNNGSVNTLQAAAFVNENWGIANKFNLDLGLRYEFVRHDGEKDRSMTTATPGGLDGDRNTAYDNSTIVSTGETDAFNFKYDYLSWSLGGNFIINGTMSTFARFTSGHKAPEVNYYFNNFDNIPIDQAGTVQDVWQAEAGFKLNASKLSLFATAFWSRLDNVAFSEFIFDQATNSIFFTPIQLNQTTTYGAEIESVIRPVHHFKINFIGTFQKAEANRFTVYDAAGTADNADDQVIDYSGNELHHNPKVSLEVTPTFYTHKFDAFLTWRFMGKRQANIANAFQLPSFHVFNIGASFKATSALDISLVANNVFNSGGLMNFFGPNEFGSSASAATADYIQNNPDASFVVFPVMPRSVHLNVGLRF